MSIRSWFLTVVGLVAFPTVTLAQDLPVPSQEDVGAILTVLVKAIESQQWGVLAAAIVMILVWLATKMPGLKDLFKGAVALWVGAVASVLSAFAVGYLTSHNWLAAIVAAVTATMGGGLFMLLSRALSGKPVEDKDGDGKLDPLPPEEPPAPPSA